jgi:hypothetical protein
MVDLWCLMQFSTIFQLYRGSQFYWWRKQLRDSNTIWTSSQVFYPANGKGKRTTKEEFNKYLINVRLSDDIPVNRDIPDSRPDR